jgi:hypothetical protein
MPIRPMIAKVLRKESEEKTSRSRLLRRKNDTLGKVPHPAGEQGPCGNAFPESGLRIFRILDNHVARLLGRPPAHATINKKTETAKNGLTPRVISRDTLDETGATIWVRRPCELIVDSGCLVGKRFD